MDLISWSLNLIDRVFSTLRNGKADPSCPDGTHAAGYTIDPWGKWRLVCLAQLSVEDVEDVYLFGFMIVGFLIIGIGRFLIYQAVWEQKTERGASSELCGRILRGGETQYEKLSQVDQKLCACLAHLSRMLSIFELVRKMDANLERVSARIEASLV